MKLTLLKGSFAGGWRGTAPGRPYITLLDSDRVVLEWAPAIADPNSAPVAGYEVFFKKHLLNIRCSFFQRLKRKSFSAGIYHRQLKFCSSFAFAG